MSLVPALTEVLAERLNRHADEIATLLREALAEAERRRWQLLSPEQRQTVNAEIDRARTIGEKPFPPELISRIPLSLLPYFVRRARHDLVVARNAWQEALGSYNELYRTLTMWYHEHKKLQITAAEKKAAIDGRVQEASSKTLELQRQVEALEHAESNLLQELKVRLVLVRTGVLADPEAVRAIE